MASEAQRTMTLTDFLLARIAEDEAVARAAQGGQFALANAEAIEGVAVERAVAWADHIARHDPARVLADCEAKRRIVAEHELFKSYDETGVGCDTCDWDRDWGMPNTGGCTTLRLLSLPYADHPDYRAEWRP